MTGGRSSTVLVVDDSAANRQLLSYWLRSAGFDVVEAPRGADALSLVATAPPDLVVLDVNLPDIGGLEVCRRLKSDPATAAVPVLQVSAISILPDDRIAALDGGADAYLTLPVPPGELLAVARSLLRMRRAEDAALLEAERWRAVFAKADIAMALMDLPEGRFTAANEAFCRLLGRDEGDVLAATWRDVTAPDDREPTRLAIQAAVEGADSTRLEKRYLAEDGQPRAWAMVTYTVVRDRRGRPVQLAGHAVDLTARKRHEELLELARAEEAAARRLAVEVSEAKTSFISRMSHEFRTPLNAIIGFSELLLADGGSDDQVEALTHILGAGRHLAALVTEVLDLARIEAGKLSLSVGPVEVGPLVATAVGMVAPLASAARIDLSTGPGLDRDVRVHADRLALGQLLLNLLSNAVKYNQPGGQVEVGGEARGATFRLWVRDTGPGISTEKLARLFKPFERLDASPDTEGTGLGLALSHQMASAMGGSLGVESEPGRGSTFWIDLPEFTAPGTTFPAAAARGEPDDAALQGGGALVLVADDDPVNRQLTGLILERMGYRVDTVGSGREALDAHGRRSYAALVLDGQMPGLDGYATAAEIRRREGPAGPHVPIVALTASALADDVERAMAAGMDAHVAKPLDRHELARTLSALTGRRRSSLPPHGGSGAGPDEVEGGPAIPLLDRPVLAELREMDEDGTAARRVVGAFLREIPGRIVRFRRAMADGDAAAVADAAHSLTGSAATFGALRVASLAQAIEQAALAGNLPDPAMATALEAALEETQEALGREVGALAR